MQFQVAVKTGASSIKTMYGTIGDPGMKTNQGKPLSDDANQRLIDVLGNLTKADAALSVLLKNKNLPKNMKSALPASVK